MSGLLDKANQSVKSNSNVTKGEDQDLTIVETIAEPMMLAESKDSGFDAVKLQFQLGAGAVLIVTMVIVFILDNKALFAGITLDDLFLPGIILSWLVFNGKDLMEQEFDAKMLGASAIGILLVSGVFAGLSFFNSGSVTISNIEFDGEANEIDLTFYGPSGMEYTVEVLVDGDVKYTRDAVIDSSKGRLSVSLDDFWDGNAEDMNGKELIEYEILVTSNGEEDSMKFNDIMNREIDTAYISVQEKFTYDSGGENRVYEGIYLNMIVGIGTPNAEFDFEEGIFTGKEPLPVESDWTAEIRVLGGSEIPEYSVYADEGIANGYGDFNFDWVSLYSDGGYLEKDDFYGDDGCYTFEITIVNEHGETLVSTDSRIEFFWDENEAGGDKAAEAC
ncbi:MAG: hypothetical protein DWC02_06770 [Candidatus Poseidoniales archaeon]|nr:MAG: hypothetical protein DWC02_06770 [Candidatus Poseidoniales archaeon]